MELLGASVSPHGGSWVAWLGGELDDTSYISQSVTIPADSSTLRYWYWIGSEDACGYDLAWVRINNVSVKTIDLCSDTDTGGWVPATIDLAGYAGQTIALQIRVETDGSLNSNYFVDDVTLGASSIAYNTFLPLAFSNFWASYFDDFSNPASGWMILEDEFSIVGYLNGEYQVYFKQADRQWFITPGITGQDLLLPSDYRVEVDARRVSAGVCSYGLRFGVRWTPDSFEGYQMVIYPTTGEFYVEKRMLDGSWTEMMDWTYSPAINPDSGSNHIAVERIGSAIRLYVNGTQVADLSDSSFMGSGRDAGVVVYTYDDPPVDDVRFDNFYASQP